MCCHSIVFVRCDKRETDVERASGRDRVVLLDERLWRRNLSTAHGIVFVMSTPRRPTHTVRINVWAHRHALPKEEQDDTMNLVRQNFSVRYCHPRQALSVLYNIYTNIFVCAICVYMWHTHNHTGTDVCLSLKFNCGSRKYIHLKVSMAPELCACGKRSWTTRVDGT